MAARTTPTFVRPEVPAGSHPVETTRYIIPTPSISRFYDAILQWIETRAPGGMIYGKPRFGKTRAIQYLTGLLAERYGAKLPVITLPCRDYRIPSETTFFEDLLRAAGHAMYRAGKAAAKRDRLIEFLSEKVEMSLQNRLVLFLDEAQKLHEQQYKWLIDLYNDLDARQITPVFLLVGQDELAHQYSAFQQTRKTQIIGRFMVHQLQFRGLREEKEIKACLKAYDRGSEHPRGSGWSFTRYYYPAAFSSGFRLETYAHQLWEAFRLLRDECGVPGPPEIPMQYFCRSVEYVLTKLGTLEDTPADITGAVWKKAVKASGYTDAERHYNNLEWHP